MTAYRITANKLRDFVRNDINRGYTQIRVGNFSYVDKPLHLGELTGNRFTLLLRYVSVDPVVCIQPSAAGASFVCGAILIFSHDYQSYVR
jgi:tRNA(Glu) U13 pseudouridine synthase TruD